MRRPALWVAKAPLAFQRLAALPRGALREGVGVAWVRVRAAFSDG